MLLSICLNHALIDGNKRLALAATIVMLGINGWELTLSNDDAYELFIAVAEGQMREVDDVAKALMAGSQRFG